MSQTDQQCKFFYVVQPSREAERACNNAAPVQNPQALQSDLQWCPRLFLHRFRLEFPGISAVLAWHDWHNASVGGQGLDDCTIEVGLC